jgi:beta-lactamase class A
MKSKPQNLIESMKSMLPVAFACLMIGGGAGAAITASLQTRGSAMRPEHEAHQNYKFINPLLACGDEFSRGTTKELNNFESQVKELIDARTNSGKVNRVSVYFRELNDGPWMGINQDDLFTPGSLLKVPLALSLYKMAERDPDFLAQKIGYTGTEIQGVDQKYPAPALPKGEYSIETLIEHMLVYSDNNAAQLLSTSISQNELLEAYSTFDITPPSFGHDYEMPVRSYAAFFRYLYNATYLTQISSEHVLSLLAKSTFLDGIVAGVPRGTVVAHKFGERDIDALNVTQLHDCGIVYAKNPFLICVMTKGTNIEENARIIADITRLAYEYAK